MKPLTVLTWLWNQNGGRATFTATNVNIWAAMIRRHCRLNIELACVTDMPDGIDPAIRIIGPPGEFEGLQTARWKAHRPSCYRRLSMFRRDAAKLFGAERFVCMDLDVVIGGRIDRILDREEDFMICPPSTAGKRWRYNGSMMLITAGCRPRVYEDFTPARAEEASTQFVGSDQAWLGYILGPGERTWDACDGVTRWPEKGKMMFFPGSVKPWDALGDEWVAEHYRMSGSKRGLILGRNGRVWDDARAAIARGIKGPVIALEAAASQWPGRVDAVARDMPHAHALARMLGVAQPVVCGG